MKKLILTAAFILMILSPLVPAQPPDADLRDEIEVMEAVLGRLIDQNTNAMALMGSDARGFYIKDYGVIFNVAYPAGQKVSVFISSANNNEKPGPVTSPSKVEQFSLKGDEQKEKKDVTPEVKKTLSTFFAKYASSITGLKPEEKISVVVDLKGFPFMPALQKDDSPSQLIATTTMKDILDMKKGSLSVEQIEKQIIFNEIDVVDQEAAIFSNVIETSLKQVKEDSGLGFKGNVKSLYIKGHGIVFMVDSDLGMIKGVTMITKNLSGTRNETSDVLINADPKTLPGMAGGLFTLKADEFKDYEEKLVKVISKYGHTLSKVKPDEYVEVALNFNRFGNNKENSRDIIKVKKADIDDLNSGKIDLENFRKRVNTIYY
jgi:hypothetical protein